MSIQLSPRLLCEIVVVIVVGLFAILLATDATDTRLAAFEKLLYCLEEAQVGSTDGLVVLSFVSPLLISKFPLSDRLNVCIALERLAKRSEYSPAAHRIAKLFHEETKVKPGVRQYSFELGRLERNDDVSGRLVNCLESQLNALKRTK